MSETRAYSCSGCVSYRASAFGSRPTALRERERSTVPTAEPSSLISAMDLCFCLRKTTCICHAYTKEEVASAKAARPSARKICQARCRYREDEKTTSRFRCFWWIFYWDPSNRRMDAHRSPLAGLLRHSIRTYAANEL